jgi:cardiolipin synthase (CMP-forming)
VLVTIPNLISIGRLFLVPLCIWLLIAGHPVWAFWMFLLAGVSDALDGFLARRFNMKSTLGSYLDPLADKALLISMYVVFATLNEVHVWVTILIVSRDILIIGGVILAWMLGLPMAMRPNWISKANTLAQIVLAAIILADLAFSPDLATIRTYLSWVVSILTIASTFAYALEFVRHMGGVEGPGSPSVGSQP